jgi:hypothetical protein
VSFCLRLKRVMAGDSTDGIKDRWNVICLTIFCLWMSQFCSRWLNVEYWHLPCFYWDHHFTWVFSSCVCFLIRIFLYSLSVRFVAVWNTWNRVPNTIMILELLYGSIYDISFYVPCVHELQASNN